MDVSIKNTTREERKEIAKQALAIAISGADVPDKEVIQLTQEYIDGKIEIEELQKKVISYYKGAN